MGKTSLQVDNYKQFLPYSSNCLALHVVEFEVGSSACESRLESGDRGPLCIILGYWILLDGWKPLKGLIKGEAWLDLLFGSVECELKG